MKFNELFAQQSPPVRCRWRGSGPPSLSPANDWNVPINWNGDASASDSDKRSMSNFDGEFGQTETLRRRQPRPTIRCTGSTTGTPFAWTRSVLDSTSRISTGPHPRQRRHQSVQRRPDPFSGDVDPFSGDWIRSAATSIRSAATSIRSAATSIRSAGTSIRSAATSIRSAATSIHSAGQSSTSPPPRRSAEPPRVRSRCASWARRLLRIVGGQQRHGTQRATNPRRPDVPPCTTPLGPSSVGNMVHRGSYVRGVIRSRRSTRRIISLPPGPRPSWVDTEQLPSQAFTYAARAELTTTSRRHQFSGVSNYATITAVNDWPVAAADSSYTTTGRERHSLCRRLACPS